MSTLPRKPQDNPDYIRVMEEAKNKGTSDLDRSQYHETVVIAPAVCQSARILFLSVSKRVNHR
jgi:hypothetical protein